MFLTSKLLSLAALSFMFLSVTACNTMAGIGQDVEKAGDSLENSAERNKNY